ncbi:hypothetical protein DSL72_003402 [Monilinia vaccinii-corymbosi]|uniref:C2H2-type domain-containing protein n=1 Tax=Monilinia vaccinii-corymbosi TaxID=61207 RepID=A0A8A3P140_9HELO|nr:hypothetical protein DSL72_003402 [Monilinia vaccinii-corymbosi]
MPPIRSNESDEDSDPSEVDVAETGSVALSDTSKSTVNEIASDSPPEVDMMNGDHSQTVSATSNTGPNVKIIDLDAQPSSDEEGFEEEALKTAPASLQKDKLPIQNTAYGAGKPSATEMGPQIDRSETPLNTLKRKSCPSESPRKASASPVAYRPHFIPTSRQPSAAFSDHQFTTHHSSTSESKKIEEETAVLRETLLHVSTEAAQAILREQWRNFLFTNAEDYHITFVLRAGLKNANPNSLSRVFKDSSVMKETLVEAISSKQPVVAKVLKSASANQISDLVPSKILDQALAERLKNVPAKTLIRWLAEADRLGYSLDDILDETDETVIPNNPGSVQSYDGDTEMAYEKPKKPEPPSLDPLMAEQQRLTALQKAQFEAQLEAQQHAIADLRCPTCTYKFDTVKGYNFHRSKNICTKIQPPGLKFYCSNCAQGFTTKQGMLYHEKKRVCLGEEGGDDEEVLFPDHIERVAALEHQRPASHSPRAQYLTDLNANLHAEHYPHGPNNPVQIRNIPRPPLHTPVASKHIVPIIAASPMEDGARQSPSELTPAKRAALEAALQRIEDKYIADQAAIPADWPADKREARLVSLKNGNASRKSQIRKAFGVTLRMRDKDKEAKKRREVLEVLGTIPHSSLTKAGDKQFEDFRHSKSSMAGDRMSAQPMETPKDRRMNMVDVRPTTGFSPINAQPQHHPPSQAPPGHQVVQHSTPLNTQSFLPRFPSVTPLISHPRSGQYSSLDGHGPRAPEKDYGGEDHANKRVKRNSNAGMTRGEEERIRHFGPSDSAPFPAHARSSPGSSLRGGMADQDGLGMLMREGHSRPSSSDSSSRGGHGNSARPVKKVPIGGLQSRWEALNGKGSGRGGAGAGVMMSVEGGGTEKADEETRHVVMDKGKGVQPAGARGMNVVDLISDDSSGNPGDSGDDN